MKRTYTAADVAGLLEVSPRTVDRWISSGKIPSFRIGGVRRVPIEEFHREFPKAPRLVPEPYSRAHGAS